MPDKQERDRSLHSVDAGLLTVLREARRFVQVFLEPIQAEHKNVYAALAFSDMGGPFHKAYAESSRDVTNKLPLIDDQMKWTRCLIAFFGA